MNSQVGWKRSNGKRSSQRCIEALEGRYLLADGALSAVVGETLFYVSTNGWELWKSNLDGSGATKLKSWTGGKGPTWLTAVEDTLYFSAGAAPTSSTSGRELWKSNGLDVGTVLVRDIYPGNQASDPHDLVVVNHRLMFVARASSWTSVFMTDGTWDGTIGLIGRSNFYLPTNLQVVNDRLYVDLYNGDMRQQEWWQSDATLAGTTLIYGSRLNAASVLEVFGGDGDSTIILAADGPHIGVIVNGMAQTYLASQLSGIKIWGQQGDDTVRIDPSVAWDVSIYGNAGNDSLEGGSGDDWIEDQHGRNWLGGGAGSDTLAISGGGHTELNTLLGGEGDDNLTADVNARISLLIGGHGNDTMEGGLGPNTIDGGAGDDSLRGDSDDDLMFGGDGDDYIFGDDGEDTLNGGIGADTINAGLGLDSIVGDSADTVNDPSGIPVSGYGPEVTGTHGVDIILVRPKRGNPAILEVVINGLIHEFSQGQIPTGRMRIATGDGNDVIALDPAVTLRTSLVGGGGDDTIMGGGGRDLIEPGNGDDLIDGGGGEEDTLSYVWSVGRLLKTRASLPIIRTDDGERDIFHNFEHVELGYGNDIFLSDRAVDGIKSLSGGDGNDMLMLISTQGMAPATINGNDGMDTLIGSAGDVFPNGSQHTIIYQAQLPPLPALRAVRTPTRIAAMIL